MALCSAPVGDLPNQNQTKVGINLVNIVFSEECLVLQVILQSWRRCFQACLRLHLVIWCMLHRSSHTRVEPQLALTKGGSHLHKCHDCFWIALTACAPSYLCAHAVRPKPFCFLLSQHSVGGLKHALLASSSIGSNQCMQQSPKTKQSQQASRNIRLGASLDHYILLSFAH